MMAPKHPLPHPGCASGERLAPGASSIGSSAPTGPILLRCPAKRFRLVVGEVELAGRWVCVGQEFVRLGDATEEL